MKKILVSVLVAALSIAAFAGCSGGKARTGYSVHTSISSSKAATAEAAGKVQVDTIIVYTTTGSDGKIINTGVESAQTAIPFDASGQISPDFDLGQHVPTKTEKGEGYGMKKNSGIGKEWFEQASAFSSWAAGKTVAQVTGLTTKKVDDNHTRVPDTADLSSTVSIDVGEFLDGVQAASQNPLLGNDASGKVKTGMGVVTSVAKSKSATADADGTGQVDSTIAIVTLDSSGKIVQCKVDVAQTRVSFGADGSIKSDTSVPAQSKQQIKDGYGMIKASGIGKEWYQQADAFAQWCIGKTLDQVNGLATKKVDDNHLKVPDSPELSSTVSIDVGEFIEAINKAVASAK